MKLVPEGSGLGLAIVKPLEGMVVASQFAQN